MNQSAESNEYIMSLSKNIKNTQEHSRTMKNMKNTIAFRENISNLYNALKEEKGMVNW